MFKNKIDLHATLTILSGKYWIRLIIEPGKNPNSIINSLINNITINVVSKADMNTEIRSVHKDNKMIIWLKTIENIALYTRIIIPEKIATVPGKIKL